MIGRRWRGFAHAASAEAYLEHLRESTLPQLRRIDGHRGAYVLRRSADERIEFVVLTLWDSLDSVRAFAGDDYEAAVVPAAARRLLAEFDDRVVHYDVVIDTTRGDRLDSG